MRLATLEGTTSWHLRQQRGRHLEHALIITSPYLPNNKITIPHFWCGLSWIFTCKGYMKSAFVKSGSVLWGEGSGSSCRCGRKWRGRSGWEEEVTGRARRTTRRKKMRSQKTRAVTMKGETTSSRRETTTTTQTTRITTRTGTEPVITHL